MNKQHIFNFFNGIITLLLSLFVYFNYVSIVNHNLILISSAIIIIGLTNLIKKGNKHAGHLVSLLLLMNIGISISVILISKFTDINIVFINSVIILSNIINLTYFIKRFIWIKKNINS